MTLYEMTQALNNECDVSGFALAFHVEDKHEKGMWPVG